MKLKVQHLMDAMVVLASIINEKRPMPQTGKYRLGRMHAKLLPEFKIINEKRDEMIKAYNTPQMKPGPDGVDVPTGEFLVPAEFMPEFLKNWGELADQEIEVDVEPIPLKCLSLGDMTDGAIEASEIVTLGDLVKE